MNSVASVHPFCVVGHRETIPKIMASDYTSGAAKPKQTRRSTLAFELIDHNSGHVIMSFDSRRQALSETCLWIKANPGANTDVSLVFRDANTSEVHFSAAGNELEELCSDEVVDDGAYDG